MIAQQQATIKGDQAAIEYAKTELSYTKLVAPFDGVAGIRLLDVGNIIHSSTTRVLRANQMLWSSSTRFSRSA